MTDKTQEHEDAQEQQSADIGGGKDTPELRDEKPEPISPEDEIQTLRDQLLRKVAEFENFKRRTREEKEVLTQLGTEILMRDLLPVIDDFERSLAATQEHSDIEAIQNGVQIIYAKLMKILEHRGLVSMDSKGKPFDVEYHDALLQVPTAEVEPGTVVDVVEKGYLLRDRVLRHAKVTVSREMDEETPEADA